jgi:hypothetical protein
MTSLSRRLQRLEATTARLDQLGRGLEFEEFSRTAEEYIRAAREYLGEPTDLDNDNLVPKREREAATTDTAPFEFPSGEARILSIALRRVYLTDDDMAL